MASKRKHLTLHEKVKIIEEWEKSFGISKVQFARQFQIPESTLKGILACKEKILEATKQFGLGSKSKRQKIQCGRSEEFDNALLEWFHEARASNIPISGVIFKENAILLAEKFGMQNFQASAGWLAKFKERYGLAFKSISGESGSVDEKIVEEWKIELKGILDGYDQKNIFNADETGLFYNMMPNKTLSYKSEKCFGGKLSKERLTVLLCTNADGSEKLPPLVIGKSRNPRCFKNTNKKPCEYQNNTKAWMTSSIFIDWIRKFDAKMHKEKRKVLLLIDRCTAHPPNIPGLTNLTIHFLPANCTSKLQPLDLGIIRSVKAYYRKSLIRKLINNSAERDRMKTRKFTILEAMHMVTASWKEVSSSTIKNCFRVAGIYSEEVEPPFGVQRMDLEINEDDITPEEWRSLVEDDVTIQDFYNCDESVLTTDYRNIEEIFEEIRNENTVSDDENEIENTDEIPPPSYTDATSALDVLRRYIISSNMENDTFTILENLEERITKTRRKMKQSTLLDFFKT